MELWITKQELKIEFALSAKVLAVANTVVVRENMLTPDMENQATRLVCGVLAPEFVSSVRGKVITKAVRECIRVF